MLAPIPEPSARARRRRRWTRLTWTPFRPLQLPSWRRSSGREDNHARERQGAPDPWRRAASRPGQRRRQLAHLGDVVTATAAEPDSSQLRVHRHGRCARTREVQPPPSKSLAEPGSAPRLATLAGSGPTLPPMRSSHAWRVTPQVRDPARRRRRPLATWHPTAHPCRYRALRQQVNGLSIVAWRALACHRQEPRSPSALPLPTSTSSARRGRPLAVPRAHRPQSRHPPRAR
mmetsp:Transcript_2561/g.8768  ORF Transcript_2561/g.8768 Transcript_2561/m.8768 type:complete len:231 (+) Transcript_2561:2502-3194(+)